HSHHENRDRGRAQHVRQVVIGQPQLFVAVLQLVVDRRQFFIGRLQLFLGRAQFLVRALQFLVRRARFFVGRLKLLGRGFVLLGGSSQILPELRNFPVCLGKLEIGCPVRGLRTSRR